MVELLNEQGVHIMWERVRQKAQGAVARPHIAQILITALFSFPNAGHH